MTTTTTIAEELAQACEEQQEALRVILQLRPMQAGLPVPVWTGPMIGDPIAERFGVRGPCQLGQRGLLGTSRAEIGPTFFQPKKQTHHEEDRPEDV